MSSISKRLLKLTLVLAGVVVLLVGSFAIWRLTRAVSTTPDQLTLYSIDGRDPDRRQHLGSNEDYHGYPVLGKLEVADAAQRRQIMRALNEGITGSNGTSNKCFWPRHGIRTV